LIGRLRFVPPCETNLSRAPESPPQPRSTAFEGEEEAAQEAAETAGSHPLDGGPFKRCRSPKVYTLGVGKHVFRVRAIGWTGLRGPQEVARFEVCHPTYPPQCQGKPSPSWSLLRERLNRT
jgi:hypothetical protein